MAEFSLAELGGTPPPLNGQSLCSKKLSGMGGTPPRDDDDDDGDDDDDDDDIENYDDGEI